MSERLILLHDDDNVLIAVSAIESGDMIPVAGGTVPAREGIAIGHKVARVALAPGDWIHMHNMKSDYIAAHSRAAAGDAA